MTEKYKYKDKDAFKVPEDYFEDFTGELMSKVAEPKGRRNIFIVIRPHLMLAASMIFIVAVSYTALRLLLPEVKSNNEIYNTTELADYLSFEVDQLTILESMETTETSAYIDNYYKDMFSDKEIIDYLTEEDLMHNELIDNL